MTHKKANTRKNYRMTLGFAAVFLLSVVAAATSQAAEVRVSDAIAHVMEDSVNGRRIEVYMTIENTGAASDRLYAVRSKLSRKTVLAVVEEADHGTDGSSHNAMGHSEAAMHMQTRVLEVPAGETTTLRHGRSHIMLNDPKESPAVGRTFPVTLFFEQAGRISVEVTVEPADMGH